MPFISVSTSKTLDAGQKEAIQKGLGSSIPLLPNKTEKVLMIDLSDGHSLYFDGKEMANGAYVDVRMYGSAGFAQKAAYTEAVYKLLGETLGLKESEVYVTFGEYSTWGTQGKLK